MKKPVIALVLAAAVSTACVFGGCSLTTGTTTGTTATSEISIVSIVKSDNGITVTYSDGTSEEIEVNKGENGADGADGEDLTVNELWEYYNELYDPDLTYDEFLTKYLSNIASDLTDEVVSVSTMLRSCFKVYANHHETITTSSSSNYGPNKTTTTTGEQAYTGGAFIYKMDENYTYLITNYHVVYDSNAITDDSYGVSGDSCVSKTVYAYMYGSEDTPTYSSSTYEYTFDGDYVVCDYIGGSIDHDIAVLRVATTDIKKLNTYAQAVTVADTYYVGESVYAIGNPQGEGISVTNGVVSVDSEYVTLSIDGTSRYYRSLRTDAALDHGNSGGGLFNASGELIGVVNSGEVVSVITSSGTTDTIPTSRGNAIPASIMTGVADCVIDSYTSTPVTPTKFVLGVTAQIENSRYVYDTYTNYGHIEEDIKVTEVTSSSVASTLGLKAGDYITAITINDTTYTLNRRYEIGDLFLTVRKNNKITVTYKRENESKTTDQYTVASSSITSFSSSATATTSLTSIGY